MTTVRIAPVPDVIDISRLEFRKDGTSIYRPPGEERFVTKEHLDHEQYLVDVALMPVRQRVTRRAGRRGAGRDRPGLLAAARRAKGLLTSQRLINCLVAPAGTGKTHVIAAFARAWASTRRRARLGLTASTNAARVMADEAQQAGAPMETFNIAQFLGKIKDSDETRGHVPVYPGDVLVVDEATQVSTEDMLRIVQIAEMAGAMVILAVRPRAARLGRRGRHVPPDRRPARVVAADRGAPVQERLGARGLAEAARGRYRRRWPSTQARGRIYHGPQDRVYDDAVTRGT